MTATELALAMVGLAGWLAAVSFWLDLRSANRAKGELLQALARVNASWRDAVNQAVSEMVQADTTAPFWFYTLPANTTADRKRMN